MGLSLLVFSISGCNKPCVGVGCEDAFGAALVSLFPGNEIPDEGEINAEVAAYTLTGNEALGPDWEVVVAQGALIIGSATDGNVRSYTPELGTSETNSDADGRIGGDHEGDHFGTRIASIQAADGSTDLLVSAPLRTLSADNRHNGTVYRLAELGDGFTGAHSLDEAIRSVSGTDPGGRFGMELAVCPDLDGDGEPEWMATADRDDTNASFAGQVVLVQSDTIRNMPQQISINALDTRWTGTDVGEKAGHALSCEHDIDGDGIPDLLIGAPFADLGEEAEGVVYILSGSDLPDRGDLRDIAPWQLSVGESNDWFGWSISSGDIDGDGNIDLAVGAPGTNDATGVVRVWSGVDLQNETLPRPAHTLVGELPGDAFGRSVMLSDLDGDGLDDLIIGAPFVDPTDTSEAFHAGQVSIYRGSTDFEDWSPQMDSLDAHIVYEEDQQYLRTGRHLFTGQFDDDEQTDLVLLQRTAVE